MAVTFTDIDDDFDAVVCAPRAWFSEAPPDTEQGSCAICGQAVLFSSTTPRGSALWCLPCTAQYLENDERSIN